MTKRFMADAAFHQTLSGVTFAEAQAQAEALFKALGVGASVCAYALDMSLPRIRALDAASAGFRAIPYPFAQAADADEGYFMVYRAQVDGTTAAEDFFYAFVFVDGRGMAALSLRSQYTLAQKTGAVPPEAAESAYVADVCRQYNLSPSDDRSTGIKLYTQRHNGQIRLTPYYTFRYEAPLFSGERVPMHAAYSIIDGQLLFSGTGVRPVE